jgi:hypothetical protein
MTKRRCMPCHEDRIYLLLGAFDEMDKSEIDMLRKLKQDDPEEREVTTIYQRLNFGYLE